ncbi:MAG: outer membrane lipoprotein chaperone LolA [Betaproteobacteria bacterium]|nr:outer membrane lipoprotein chaperone LolA [Betaproteobacteria bacterium]
MGVIGARLGATLALAGTLLLADSATAWAGGVERLRSFLDQTRTARAAFSQTVTAKSGRKPQTASGDMVFSRPGRFRWTYDKPYHQLLVGDGERLWIYDKDLNQVSVRKLGGALGSSPAALLAGDNTLERNFDLRDGGSRDGLEWVEAQPKNAESSFEQVSIGFSGDVPQRMELRDAFGQTTVLVFSAFERNPRLDAAQFRFVPPAGADVVGGE